jgi:hypothetical protein
VIRSGIEIFSPHKNPTEHIPDSLHIEDDWNEQNTDALERIHDVIHSVDPAVFEGNDSRAQREAERKISHALRFPFPIDRCSERDIERFITIVDVLVIAKRAAKTYDDSPLEHSVNDLFSALEQEGSILVRRKINAITNRHTLAFDENIFPKNPNELRAFLRRYPENIYLIDENHHVVYLESILKENPRFLDDLSDDELLAITWEDYFTGDEGVTEELFRKKLKERYHDPNGPRTEKANPIITTIAPHKYGAFDDVGRFLGVVTADGKRIPLTEDDDIRRLHTSTNIVDAADAIAFAMDLRMREDMEHDFHIRLDDLSLEEQVAFFHALEQKTPEQENNLVRLSTTFGLEGVRSLLLGLRNKQTSDALIFIGTTFDHAVAQSLFHHLSEIGRLAQATVEHLGRQFFVHNTHFDANSVRNSLLRRAEDIVATATRGSTPEDIEEHLSQARADLVLFATMFRHTQKNTGEVRFEDLKGVRIETVHGGEIGEHDHDAMIGIAHANWIKQKPEVATMIINGFERALTSQNTDVVLLRKDHDIGAFVRFDRIDASTVYAASLNVNPALRSAGLGESMLKTAIDRVARDNVILADVFPELPIAMKYVQEFGCVITGIEDVPLDDGTTAPRLCIRRDDERNRHYEGKQSSLVPHRSFHAITKRFDLSHGTAALVQAVRDAARHHMVGTQFFADSVNPAIRYIVFEPDVTLEEVPIAAK